MKSQSCQTKSLLAEFSVREEDVGDVVEVGAFTGSSERRRGAGNWLGVGLWQRFGGGEPQHWDVVAVAVGIGEHRALEKGGDRPATFVNAVVVKVAKQNEIFELGRAAFRAAVGYLGERRRCP